MAAQAEYLYRVVPAVYRNRDTGDLQKYFRGVGLLMDQINQTLEQKLADNFPDNPPPGEAGCQEWLLPYFADLLDVRLVSPTLVGKRAEIANAISWRQGRGTLRVVEEIAEAVGRMEVIIQEGWQRVATTARLNQPRFPATAFGYAADLPLAPPAMAARHPGLPAVTPDLRCPSGAVRAGLANPAAQQTTVDGSTRVWRQSSRHGAPCHPGHFDDVSVRTVDFRTPDWRCGHYHPNQLLLYRVPPAGFFPVDMPTVNWTEDPGQAFLDLIEIIEDGNTTIYRNRTFHTDSFQPVRVRKVIRLGQVESGVGDADFHTWRFEGLVLDNTLEVDSGRLELAACAVRIVEVHSVDKSTPVLVAKDCLIKKLQVASSLAQLEYCTVLDPMVCEIPNASDCIFRGLIRRDHLSSDPPARGCLRYSALLQEQQKGGLSLIRTTREPPVFFATGFGERSCGVLHPAAPVAITAGAADGSEMGAFHFLHLSLLPDALLKKLTDYLPVGISAVTIPDSGLLEAASPL
jgi:hypothetical protein